LVKCLKTFASSISPIINSIEIEICRSWKNIDLFRELYLTYCEIFLWHIARVNLFWDVLLWGTTVPIIFLTAITLKNRRKKTRKNGIVAISLPSNVYFLIKCYDYYIFKFFTIFTYQRTISLFLPISGLFHSRFHYFSLRLLLPMSGHSDYSEWQYSLFFFHNFLELSSQQWLKQERIVDKAWQSLAFCSLQM
jgi:hypothetical protein